MRKNVLSHGGPGVAELELRPGEEKQERIPALGVTLLWLGVSSGPGAHTHCFTPVLSALESSWTKPLHAVIACPVHSLFLNCFGGQGRNLFCLGPSFCHKNKGFLAKRSYF